MTTSFSSGSTRFGDDTSDTHQFTGSLQISGAYIDFTDTGVSTLRRKSGEFLYISESFLRLNAQGPGVASPVIINLDGGSTQKIIDVNAGTHDVDFVVRAGSLGVKPFFIEGSTGNVGIGTLVTSKPLTVAGDISASGDYHGLNGTMTLGGNISGSSTSTG